MAGLFLAVGLVLGAQAAPSIKVPGRKPDSKEPWGAFLGRTAHLIIGAQYQLEHPTNTVFLDPTPLYTILEEGQLGDASRLPKFVRHLRPDITDTDIRVLFAIKPDHARKNSSYRANWRSRRFGMPMPETKGLLAFRVTSTGPSTAAARVKEAAVLDEAKTHDS